MADYKRKEQASATADIGEASPHSSPVAEDVPGGAPRRWRAGLPWNLRDAERNEAIERKEREEKDLVQSPVTAYGRPDQHVLDDDGEVKQRRTGGAVQREEDKGKFSWLTGLKTWGSGREEYAADGDKQTSSVDSHKTTFGPRGLNIVSTNSKKVEVIDVRATARAVKKELEAEKALAQQEIENDPAAKQAAEARIAKLDAAIATVDAASDNGEELKKLCAQHRIVVEPKYKVVGHEEVTYKDKLEYSLWKGSFDNENEAIETKTDGSGAISTTTQNTSRRMNLSEGTVFEQTISNKEDKQNADGTSESRTVEPTAKMSIEASKGEIRFGSEDTHASSKSGADGKSIESASTTTKRSDAFIAGKDGVGAKSGGGIKRVETQGEKSTEMSADGHVGVTNKGLLFDASASVKQSDGKIESHVKPLLNGAFLIEVLQPDEESELYRIVTTVRLGGGGTYGVGDKKQEDKEAAQNSFSLSMKGGASIVYTHVMTHDQVQRYIADAERAQAAKALDGGAEFPEFGMLAKLKAFADGETMTHPGAVFGSTDSVASMAAGDSVQYALSADIEAKLGLAPGGAAKGFGAGGSAADRTSRTVTVTKDKDGMVIVTIGFAETQELAEEVSGTFEGASAKMGASQSKGDGDEYTFKLDPNLADYEVCYQLILHTWSRDELKGLGDAEPLKGHVERKKTTEEHKDGTTAAVGGAGLMFNTGVSHQGSSEISQTPDGAEGKFSGGQSQSASVSLGDINLLGVKRDDTANAAVDSHGTLSADFQTGNSETNLGTTLSNAGKTIKGWFGIHEDKETKVTDVVTGALEATPAERLKELLEKQYTRLSGYKLGEADVLVLVNRAQDEQKWTAACKSWRALAPMEKLRNNLLAPHIDKTLIKDEKDDQQVERAVKLALAKALADFMESSGAPGMEAIGNVMRNWGATYNKPSTAAGIGARYEWPPSLAKHRVIYEKAEKVLSHATSVADEVLQDPSATAKWHELSDALIGDLDGVHAALVATHDMHDEGARAEMLNNVSAKKAALVAANRYFDRAAANTATGPQTNHEIKPDAPRPDTDAADPQALVEMFANERITTLLVDLAALKTRERQLFTVAYANPGKHDTSITVRKLYELYETWISMIKELRGHYTATKEDPRTWQVSAGPDSKKHVASTEPYVEEMINIGRTAGLADYDTPAFADRLRSRFAYY